MFPKGVFLYAQRGITPLFILAQSLNYTSCLSSGLENFNSLRQKLLSVLRALITVILSFIFPPPTLGAALLTVFSGSQPSQSLLIIESLLLVTIIQSLLFKNVNLLFNLLKHSSSFSTDQPWDSSSSGVCACVCVCVCCSLLCHIPLSHPHFHYSVQRQGGTKEQNHLPVISVLRLCGL